MRDRVIANGESKYSQLIRMRIGVFLCLYLSLGLYPGEARSAGTVAAFDCNPIVEKIRAFVALTPEQMDAYFKTVEETLDSGQRKILRSCRQSIKQFARGLNEEERDRFRYARQGWRARMRELKENPLTTQDGTEEIPDANGNTPPATPTDDLVRDSNGRPLLDANGDPIKNGGGAPPPTTQDVAFNKALGETRVGIDGMVKELNRDVDSVLGLDELKLNADYLSQALGLERTRLSGELNKANQNGRPLDPILNSQNSVIPSFTNRQFLAKYSELKAQNEEMRKAFEESQNEFKTEVAQDRLALQTLSQNATDLETRKAAISALEDPAAYLRERGMLPGDEFVQARANEMANQGLAVEDAGAGGANNAARNGNGSTGSIKSGITEASAGSGPIPLGSPANDPQESPESVAEFKDFFNPSDLDSNGANSAGQGGTFSAKEQNVIDAAEKLSKAKADGAAEPHLLKLAAELQSLSAGVDHGRLLRALEANPDAEGQALANLIRQNSSKSANNSAASRIGEISNSANKSRANRKLANTLVAEGNGYHNGRWMRSFADFWDSPAARNVDLFRRVRLVHTRYLEDGQLNANERSKKKEEKPEFGQTGSEIGQSG